MNQFLLSIHQLPGGVILTDKKGVIVDVNRKVTELFGINGNDLAGKSLKSLALDGEDKKIDMILNPNSETPYKIDVDFNTAEKKKLTLELRWTRITENENEQILFQVQNITHFKRVKDELNEQRRVFKTLINNLPGMVYRCKNDKNWSMEFISQYCFELTGYHPEDIIDNQKIAFNDIIHPNHRQRLWDKWQKILKNQEIFIDEYPIITASGEEKWVWEQGTGVFDANSHLIALEGIIIDIDERKRAEEALRLSEEKFRMLVENAFDGIYLMRGRRYEYANHRFEEITGYTFLELSDKEFDFNLLLTNKSKQLVEQRYNERLQGKDISNQYELQIKTKQGITREVEVSTVSLGIQGDVCVLGIMRDITERKQAQLIIQESEQKLKKQNEEYYALNEELIETNKRIKEINNELMFAKEKAEESERLKSAFLANMSHEVRTPMNGILGFSQLIQNPSLTYEERNEYVNYIHNCGTQLLSIINDLIDISKIQSNLISIKPEQVNLNELLQEQYLLFKPKADSLNLQFSFTKELPNDRCNIVTDGIRLRQILTNLIGNAFKFTSKGQIKFGYTLRNLDLEFYIEDTGVGISTDMQTSIFERFRQVETDLSRQTGGTGLGLAISKALVNKMGGEIRVESTPGFGSRFYFTLPFKPLVIKDTTSSFDDNMRYQNMSKTTKYILIAEDNEINYLYLKQLLSSIDAKFIWVKNGIDAIEQVKCNHEIDIVLMDVKMPEMDGYEATRTLKKIRKDLPVIAQTAYAFESDREKAIQAGCDDYISKPINRERFVEMVMKYLV